MSAPDFEISSFRPGRSLFGYRRKPTNEFLEQVARLLDEAQTRIAKVEADLTRLGEAEAELAGFREKEQALLDALMSAASVAETIKRDAREEEEIIRRQARELEELVASTRSEMTAFIQETLEKLERIPDSLERDSEPHDIEEQEPLEAADMPGDLIQSAEVRAIRDPAF